MTRILNLELIGFTCLKIISLGNVHAARNSCPKTCSLREVLYFIFFLKLRASFSKNIIWTLNLELHDQIIMIPQFFFSQQIRNFASIYRERHFLVIFIKVLVTRHLCVKHKHSHFFYKDGANGRSRKSEVYVGISSGAGLSFSFLGAMDV